MRASSAAVALGKIAPFKNRLRAQVFAAAGSDHLPRRKTQ